MGLMPGPADVVGTMKTLIGFDASSFRPESTSVRMSSARVAPMVQYFVPLRTKPLPHRSAVVRMERAYKPSSVSVRAEQT